MGRYRNEEYEQDERSYEARIWWVFWIIAVVVIAYTIWHQYRNYDLVHNGTCIEAEYMLYNGEEIARYRDETGRIVASYNLGGLNAIHDEDTVLLYYKDNINFAEPERELKSWLYAYVIFIPVLIGTTWKLITIYKKKPEAPVRDRWES